MKKSLFSLCVFSLPLVAHAAVYDWQTDSDGNWNVGSNWLENPAPPASPPAAPTFPNAFADTANLMKSTANRKVTLGQDISIGTLNFKSNVFEIQSGHTLSFSTSIVGGTESGTLKCPINLPGNVELQPASGKTLLFNNSIVGGGNIKVNGAGTVEFNLTETGANNTYTGSLEVAKGTFVYKANALPKSTVIVGDGTNTANFEVREDIDASKPLNVEVKTSGSFIQEDNKGVRLRDLKGTGTFNMKTGNNHVDILGDNTSNVTSTFSGKITGGVAQTQDDPAHGANKSRIMVSGNRNLTLSNASSDFACRMYVTDRATVTATHANALGGSQEGYTYNNGTFAFDNGITVSKKFKVNGFGHNNVGALHAAGGTNILSGDIAVGWAAGNVAASGASVGAVAGAELQLTGELSGANFLNKVGAGTVTLGGSKTNAMTGDIVLSQGTLKLSKSSTYKSIPVRLNVNGGSCEITANDQFADAAQMSINGGTFATATFNNGLDSIDFISGSFTGTTGITTLKSIGNALQMRGNTTTEAPIALTGASGGNVVFDPTVGQLATINDIACGGVNRTFSVPSGGTATETDMKVLKSTSDKGITKTGNGILEFAGAGPHTHSDTSNVNEGILKVNSPFTGSINVANGAFVQGSGTIGGTVTVGGTLAPGNSIGTITSNGTTFTNGSIFEVEYDDINSDLLNVVNNGSVTIDPGATIELIPHPNGTTHYFPVGVPIKHTVIQTEAGGQITGTFDTEINNSPILTTELDYSDHHKLVLTVTNQGFGSFALASGGNMNVRQIGNCLDSITPEPDSDLAGIISKIQGMTAGDMHDALESIQPSMVQAMNIVQEENSVRMRKSVMRRANFLTQKACCNAKNQNGVYLWTEGTGNYFDQNTHRHNVGFQVRSFDVKAGADMSNGDHVLMGLAGGYTHSNMDWKKSLGEGRIDSGYGDIYIGLYNPFLFLNLVAEGSYSRYVQERNIIVGDEKRRAQGKSGGATFLEHAQAGFIFNFGGLEIRPFGSVDFIYLYRGGFTEKGADSLNAKIFGQHASTLRYEGGAEIALCLGEKRRYLTLDGKIGFAREHRMSRRNSRFHLKNTGCGGIVDGLAPDRNFLVPEGGITVHLSKRSYLKFGYSGEIGSDYHNHSAHGQFGCNF